MLRFLMSTVSHYPGLVFNKPGEGDPPADGGTVDPPAGGGTLPATGEGNGDAGDDEGGDSAGGEPDGTGGDGAGDGTPPAAGAAPPAAGAPDWRDREINRKHRQIQESRDREKRLEQELEDARALLARQGGDGTPPAAGGGTPPARTVDQNEVQREARKIVAQENYATQCNDVYAKGGELYKDKWDGALKTLIVLGGLGEGDAGVEMMTSVLAADNPAQVLFKLGSNPDEYHRVMALPPAKRMAEVVKLGLEAAPKPKPRPDPSLPDPVEPVGRRARTSDPEPQDSDDDPTWYEKRARQKAARFAAKQGRNASV